MKDVLIILQMLTQFVPPPKGARHNVTLLEEADDMLRFTIVAGTNRRRFYSYQVAVDDDRTPQEIAHKLWAEHSRRTIGEFVDSVPGGD